MITIILWLMLCVVCFVAGTYIQYLSSMPAFENLQAGIKLRDEVIEKQEEITDTYEEITDTYKEIFETPEVQDALSRMQ